MTPGARIAAAIGVLDRVLAGEPAEKALINWSRGSRYAGSGDRNAVRDIVFDALRRRRSAEALGGGATGRGLVLGSLRAQEIDPAPLFTGNGHDAAPMTEADAPRALTELERLDCPDWLAPELKRSLGEDFEPVMALLQTRAPIFLRANLMRGPIEVARDELESQGIEAVPHPLASTALEVLAGSRKVATCDAYRDGLVELQDVASQAVVEALPLKDGMKVLDFCAGGGGKSLAMATRAKLAVHAHDVDPRRMQDLPDRAKRALVKITRIETARLKSDYSLVLADAPCSGSGAWRRSPEARWRLDQDGLDRLMRLQDEVLDQAAAQVTPGGILAYATCSLLNCENQDRVAAFLKRNGRFSEVKQLHLTPLAGGDGFFLSIMRG